MGSQQALACVRSAHEQQDGPSPVVLPKALPDENVDLIELPELLQRVAGPQQSDLIRNVALDC